MIAHIFFFRGTDLDKHNKLFPGKTVPRHLKIHARAILWRAGVEQGLARGLGLRRADGFRAQHKGSDWIAADNASDRCLVNPLSHPAARNHV